MRSTLAPTRHKQKDLWCAHTERTTHQSLFNVGYLLDSFQCLFQTIHNDADFILVNNHGRIEA